MATSIRTETLRWRRSEKGRVLLAESGGHFEIICKRCGERSEDASAFCGGCGAFLEWDGERVSATGSAPLPDSVSVAATAAADTAPAAVKPAMPVHRPPPIGERTVPRRVQPGDLICAKCGEGNEATRKFCRRCGSTLRQPAVVAIPWWRRFFAPRSPIPPVAGSRPASPTPGGAIQWGRALVKFIILALVVIVLLFAAIPSLRKHVTNEATSIRRSIHPTYPKIALQSATATNVGACPAPRLKDNSTVYWYTHPASGPTQVLTVTLATNFKGNVDKVGITPLAPDAPPAAGSALAYPSQVALRAAGTPMPPNITLANPPKFRSFTIKATRPPTIEVSALSTDPGAPATSCAETALIFYDRT